MRFLYRHRRLGAMVGVTVIGGMSLGAFVLGPMGIPSASAARGKNTSVNCPQSSTGITVGPYSVVCNGQSSTGATITITKATPRLFVARVAPASGTTLDSESLSLNNPTGECTYVIGLTGGTEQSVTVLVQGGTLDANLDQTGGTLNPGDPSCTFRHEK